MTKNLFLLNLSSPRSLLTIGSQWLRSPLACLTILLLTPNLVAAQGGYQSSFGNSTESNHWSAPQSQLDAPAKDVNTQALPRVQGTAGFPQGRIPFDPGVRPANFESPVAHDFGSGNSIDSTIDSTANMLANLKDVTGDKLSGMAAKLDQNGNWMEKAQSLFGSSDISRMLGSLTLVLGLYFTFVWIMRRLNPGASSGIPAEVIEVMGHIPFGPKRELQLVRLGSKLLLLMSSPEGTNSIGEITDPDEVEYLAALCPGKRQKNSESNPGSYAAIRNAANRLAAGSRTSPSSPPPQPAVGKPNLANILRTLDQAAQQNTAIFEA